MRDRAKKIFYSFLIMLLPAAAPAQNQQFVFSLSGGLFFPSNYSFRNTAQSNSDLIWGAGICLPMSSSLFTTGDVSFFSMKALVDPQIDSSMTLEEKFVHIGILNKQPLISSFIIRLSGGLSYSRIKQISSSDRSAGVTLEGDKRIGYYGGIGIEQPLDPENRFSVFADFVYDYRRSERKELYGDYGGIRIVMGVHLFLF